MWGDSGVVEVFLKGDSKTFAESLKCLLWKGWWGLNLIRVGVYWSRTQFLGSLSHTCREKVSRWRKPNSIRLPAGKWYLAVRVRFSFHSCFLFSLAFLHSLCSLLLLVSLAIQCVFIRLAPRYIVLWWLVCRCSELYGFPFEQKCMASTCIRQSFKKLRPPNYTKKNSLEITGTSLRWRSYH